MQFDTAQAGYLAGYLAAGMSKSGKVGTYGGLKIPPVTIFMDGFVDGVAHYNQVHSTNVAALGWNKATQNGLFANSFTDQAKGKQLASSWSARAPTSSCRSPAAPASAPRPTPRRPVASSA